MNTHYTQWIHTTHNENHTTHNEYTLHTMKITLHTMKITLHTMNTHYTQWKSHYTQWIHTTHNEYTLHTMNNTLHTMNTHYTQWIHTTQWSCFMCCELVIKLGYILLYCPMKYIFVCWYMNPQSLKPYVVKFWHDKTVVPPHFTQLTWHIKFRFKKPPWGSSFPKD
jgi:hypothetical protein